MIGTVRFWYRRGGYGFIRPDDRSPDVFILPRVVQQCLGKPELHEHDRLEFDVENAPYHPGQRQAKNLRLLKGEPYLS